MTPRGRAEGRRVGAVVEASTSSFVVECYELYGAPPLGRLVRCGDETTVYGVVGNVANESKFPGRRPVARGAEEETEEAVYRNNPQLRRLLATRFHAVTVGHRSDGQLFRYLSPLPPTIYSFVYECEDEEQGVFSESLDFLPILLGTPTVPQDDVVAAFLRMASRAYPDPEAFLVRSGKELAIQLVGQTQRLNSVLRRLLP